MEHILDEALRLSEQPKRRRSLFTREGRIVRRPSDLDRHTFMYE